MEITNVSQFHNELVAAGLSISGCDSSGNVHILSRPTVPEGVTDWIDPTDSVIEAVKSAHGQPLTSDECAALQALLNEEQWLAYQDARKALVRAQRQERYKQEADPLILSSIESALIASSPTDGKYEVILPEESVTNWLTVKSTIREELPYGE